MLGAATTSRWLLFGSIRATPRQRLNDGKRPPSRYALQTSDRSTSSQAAEVFIDPTQGLLGLLSWPRTSTLNAPKPLPCARMCSMGQRASSGRPILRAMSTEKHPGSLTNLQSGDVLVSHPTAVREHEISIVPNAPHTTSPTHDAAVSDGCSEADALGVDAWLTEDQTHVVKIASNRAADK